jgi:hypothetical protein
MSTQFERPVIGSKIQVTTKYHWYGSTTTKRGTVVANEDWQDEGSFSLRTDDKWMPISLINPEYVLDLRYLDGRAAKKVEVKEPPKVEIKTWQVKSSDGKSFYTVSHNAHGWSCDCKGFMFRNECRHIKEIQAKLGIKVTKAVKPIKKIVGKKKKAVKRRR